MGGSKLWDSFFSSDGLDDAPEISSLSFVGIDPRCGDIQIGRIALLNGPTCR